MEASFRRVVGRFPLARPPRVRWAGEGVEKRSLLNSGLGDTGNGAIAGVGMTRLPRCGRLPPADLRVLQPLGSARDDKIGDLVERRAVLDEREDPQREVVLEDPV